MNDSNSQSTAKFLVFSKPAEGVEEDAFLAWYGSHLTEMSGLRIVRSAQLFEAAGPEPGAQLPGPYLALYDVEGDISDARTLIEETRDSRTPRPDFVQLCGSFWFTPAATLTRADPRAGMM